MSPKTRTKKHHCQTWKWIITAIIVAIAIALLVVACSQHLPETDNKSGEPEGFKTLANHYMTIMHDLNSSETKTKISARINADYNQTQLFAWEQSKLTFQQDPAGWYEEPIQILDSGKGICVQHSIVYVSACLARGYQSRLVVAVDTSTWSFDHVWAEVYYNGNWIHTDPSDSIWNNPTKYQGWTDSWGKDIGSTVRIYAFMDGSYVDVTSVYAAK
jgi:hypothetical protein